MKTLAFILTRTVVVISKLVSQRPVVVDARTCNNTDTQIRHKATNTHVQTAHAGARAFTGSCAHGGITDSGVARPGRFHWELRSAAAQDLASCDAGVRLSAACALVTPRRPGFVFESH
jgi:hypothetical protein